MGEVIELSEATKVADVVPAWDSHEHEVPGGGVLRATCARAAGVEDWIAIDTAGFERVMSCPCYPSVQTHREGAHIGAVVVHHAFDGRTSGSSA